jgi:uncharacterized protein YneF (UPF0154 family)
LVGAALMTVFPFFGIPVGLVAVAIAGMLIARRMLESTPAS